MSGWVVVKAFKNRIAEVFDGLNAFSDLPVVINVLCVEIQMFCRSKMIMNLKKSSFLYKILCYKCPNLNDQSKEEAT